MNIYELTNMSEMHPPCSRNCESVYFLFTYNIKHNLCLLGPRFYELTLMNSLLVNGLFVFIISILNLFYTYLFLPCIDMPATLTSGTIFLLPYY